MIEWSVENVQPGDLAASAHSVTGALVISALDKPARAKLTATAYVSDRSKSLIIEELTVSAGSYRLYWRSA